MVDYGGGGGGVNNGNSDPISRFVCPNDRQLALRAKLRTGWSVKTAALGTHPPILPDQPLGPEEQAAIVNVIRRAEELDLNEQERVGRLIERLENMRRNAIGRNPQQCLLCSENFSLILGAQKLICIDCKKLFCQKCTIETTTSGQLATSSSSPLATSSPKKSTTWRLCLICAETREIWKKSGAWFFKSIPKYILPSEKSAAAIYRIAHNRVGGGGGFNTNFRNNLMEEDSSSDEERKYWTLNSKAQQRRNSSTESTHDVHELLLDSQSITTYKQSYGDISIQQQLQQQQQQIITMETKNWDKDSQESSEDQAISRRESSVSRSLSEWNWSDSRSDEKVSPSTSSVSGSVFKSILDDSKPSDSPFGFIELSLTYDPVNTTLHCTVYRAKNLIPMDINGLSDPFCKLNILPTVKVSTRLRTKTVHKTRNPEFNENLTFYDITETDLLKRSLHILIVDDDKFGHDFMGETRIALAKLKVQNTIYVTAPLEKLRNEQKGPIPTPDLNQWFDDDLWSRGQILLSLCYSTKRRSLLVIVCRCANLLPMDNNGFSDPFVKLQLKPDPYHRKHKTSIKWKNLNPIYNEEFAFESRPTELATQSLYIQVYDKDYGKSNDYLGGLILGGTGSKGQRLKQWLDMIRYPDHRHEAWHNLIEEPLD